MTALVIVGSVVAGLGVMVTTGVLAYRTYARTHSAEKVRTTGAPVAFLAMALFPLWLPFAVALWIARRPEAKADAEARKELARRRLEAEIFGDTTS